NRVDEISAIADRVATIDGDLDHHLAIVRSEVFGTLDPDRWEDARATLRRELARRAPGETTWWIAQATAQLQLLDGLDESEVRPIAERLGSPVFSARAAFFRGVPHYLRDEDATAAAFAEQAVALARSAGAV